MSTRYAQRVPSRRAVRRRWRRTGWAARGRGVRARRGAVVVWRRDRSSRASPGGTPRSHTVGEPSMSASASTSHREARGHPASDRHPAPSESPPSRRRAVDDADRPTRREAGGTSGIVPRSGWPRQRGPTTGARRGPRRSSRGFGREGAWPSRDGASLGGRRAGSVARPQRKRVRSGTRREIEGGDVWSRWRQRLPIARAEAIVHALHGVSVTGERQQRRVGSTPSAGVVGTVDARLVEQVVHDRSGGRNSISGQHAVPGTR